ncbi:acyl carrier protein 1, chloroplastic [Senna tora]|uniref:Acyl carrier protein n=1 Tax=Senna tora TaxID=362788 RepID=A0A834WX80_9FABA|nr:acyl carrier protein 1, chloroplastic [Senna tora]
MASVSATSSLTFQPSLSPQGCNWRGSGLRAVSVCWRNRSFPSSFRASRFCISCKAKAETVQKVCEVVRSQLALPPEKEVTPDTKFIDLGADSLDTVEIVMSLEETFGIIIEEESNNSITTVQEAAELIEQLVQKKE